MSGITGAHQHSIEYIQTTGILSGSSCSQGPCMQCHCALPHIHDMWFRGWALVVGTIWQCSVCRLHSLGNESESISKTPARALAAQLRGKCLSQLTSTQQALPGRTLGWQWTEPDLPSLGTGQSLGQGPSRPYASRLQEGRRDTA